MKAAELSLRAKFGSSSRKEQDPITAQIDRPGLVIIVSIQKQK